MKLKSLLGKNYNNKLNEATVGDLESKLKSHDWYYMMSDDSRAYDKGKASLGEIEKMVKELGREGLELYTKYFKKFFPQADSEMVKSSMLKEVESDFEDEFALDQSKGGVDNSLNKIYKQLFKVQQDMTKLFNDYRDGIITKDQYVAKRKPLQALRTKLENDLL
jgi:hypothetical protein